MHLQTMSNLQNSYIKNLCKIVSKKLNIKYIQITLGKIKILKTNV